MWKEFANISAHDPFIWFVLLPAIIMLFTWRGEIKRRRAIEEFSRVRGFKFNPVLDAKALRLSEADFFYRWDRVKNAVSGKTERSTIHYFRPSSAKRKT
jgi:hypothetical protein